MMDTGNESLIATATAALAIAGLAGLVTGSPLAFFGVLTLLFALNVFAALGSACRRRK